MTWWTPAIGRGFLVVAPVVVVGVDGVAGEVLAGGGVDDVDGVVVDEHQDRGVGVGDAEVVEFPGVAQGEFAEAVDGVDADAVVGGIGGGVVRPGGFEGGGVGGGGFGRGRGGPGRCRGG